MNSVGLMQKENKIFDLKKCLMIVMSLPLADKNLEINNEIADLSEKLNQAEVIIKKNNTEIGNLAASNKSEKEKNEQLKQANIWEEKYKEGIKYIESLEKENNKQIQQINAHKGEIEQHLRQIDSLKTQISILEKYKEQKTLTNQSSILQHEKQLLEAQVNTSTKKNEQLESNITNQRNELYQSQHKITQLETQFNDTKTKLHDYTVQNEKYINVLSSLTSEKDTLLSKLEHFEQQSKTFKEFNKKKKCKRLPFYFFFLAIF
ncbi:viral A-type inclusion protein [Reticulomyxa filosa]|uniref:Viral A-type inclusion protein n=1 Tax=Reticulomyxa filosa TaxID=46433 RepID=X6NEM5_RETFI|nr:viral A-type inclusion protein [Reticulomyxa filosa]|eukprot:ETO24348.1 viral A-type inclusion protein [Reticulomyxa filosa]